MDNLRTFEEVDCDSRSHNDHVSLQVAAQKGDVKLVQSLLNKGVKVDGKDGDGKTALHWSAEKGRLEVAKLLLKKGAKVHRRDKQGRTAMHIAVENGHEALVDLMVNGGYFKANGLDSLRVLALAAQHGHAAVVQQLLGMGANVAVRDKRGRAGKTALYKAAENGHVETVRILIGEDEGPRDGEEDEGQGHSEALLEAAKNGHSAVVQLLLEQGISIDSRKDSTGESALYLATANGDKEMVRLLLEKGARTDRSTDCGLTSLHRACSDGRESIVRLLLEKGASSTSEDIGGETPLEKASSHGHEAIVRLLLEKRADIDIGDEKRATQSPHDGSGLVEQVGNVMTLNLSDEERETLLQQAVVKGRKAAEELPAAGAYNLNTGVYFLLRDATKEGQKAVVELLSERGIDVNAKNGAEGLLVREANSKGYEGTVGMLLEKGVNADLIDKYERSMLFHAASEGHESTVRLLLEKGVNADLVDSNGLSMLFHAASEGHESTVRLLLEKGANVNNKYGETPLYKACCEGHEGIVQLLLEKGSDVDRKPLWYGVLPLHEASSRGFTGIARLLVGRGANINTRGRNGTPLHDASLGGHAATIMFLLEKGADINSKNELGETPLHLAVRSCKEGAVRLLVEKGADINSKGGWDRETPLHMAVKSWCKGVVWLLVEKGADLLVENGDGETPLDEARKAGHNEAMKKLLKKVAAHLRCEAMPSRNKKKGEILASEPPPPSLPPSLETDAFCQARNGIMAFLEESGTLSTPSGATRTLLNIRTGKLESCTGKTPFVIASYVCHPLLLPDSPFHDLLKPGLSNRTKADAANFEMRLNCVCEAFPQFAMKVEPEDEGIDSILLPFEAASELDEGYQHEVYTLAAREAHRRGLDHIWMDSLCIDQTSPDSKASGIRYMSMHYRDAACCVTVGEVLRRKLYFDPSFTDLGYDWLPGDDLLSWIAGYHPLRVWLFQETFLPKEVVARSGNIRIESSNFIAQYQKHVRGEAHMTLMSDDPSYTHFKEMTTRFPTSASRTEAGNRLSLDQCLELLNSRMSTIPQDRIFGALALVGGLVESRLPVNYRLPNSALHAILSFLRICDGDFNALLTLRSSREPKHQISKGPSWIPTGVGSIFQDGQGHPMEVAGQERAVQWPHFLLIVTPFMYVTDISPAKTVHSKIALDHNVLLSLETGGHGRLPGAYPGAIEPLGYCPKEGSADGSEDSEDYNANICEVRTAVQERRAVVALLKQRQYPTESKVPEARAWVLLLTSDDGQTWRRGGLMRTDGYVAGKCEEARKFRVV
jgi:ankyrin repeat protein